MRKTQSILLFFLILALTVGCTPASPAPTLPPSASATPTSGLQPTSPPPATPTPTLPPIPDTEPSYRVAAFYYPWYRTPDVDGEWVHWEQGGLNPPAWIAADFYPALGAYSSNDAAIVAQHCAWLRQARVGVLVSSWWGVGSREDQVVPLLLDTAQRYGLKVAFHIEPYGGRTAQRLVEDIQYIYQRYGAHPAFFRTTAPSRWSPDERSKGLFYLWAARFPDGDSPPVEAEYWRPAIDQIHELPDGGIVLADENEARWVDEGHFDGSYNYGVLDIDERGYNWGRDLPPGAWYVPGINPGFSGQRIGLPDNLYTPRRDGATYEQRWEAALSIGVEPALVTITSFNEWHEGHQIEPAAAGMTDGAGRAYQDYGPLPPDGYLTLTSQWVERFLVATWPESAVLRLRLTTTSDWTTFSLLSGAAWLKPDLLSITGASANANLQGNFIELTQPLDQAFSGGQAEALWEILFSGWEEGGKLVFKLERGGIGMTVLEFSRLVQDEWVVVKTVRWGGTTDDERNSYSFEVEVEELFGE